MIFSAIPTPGSELDVEATIGSGASDHSLYRGINFHNGGARAHGNSRLRSRLGGHSGFSQASVSRAHGNKKCGRPLLPASA